MRKDAKKTSRKQAKKAAVKNLPVKNSAAVKGGNVSPSEITVKKYSDKSSASFF